MAAPAYRSAARRITRPGTYATGTPRRAATPRSSRAAELVVSITITVRPAPSAWSIICSKPASLLIGARANNTSPPAVAA